MRRARPEGGREPDGEAEALAKLGEHEHELDRQLEAADQEAKALLAEARREADGLRQRAEAELSEEVERLRQDQAREVERALSVIRDETTRRGRALRRQAQLNRERTLAWLLSRVAGKGAP